MLTVEEIYAISMDLKRFECSNRAICKIYGRTVYVSDLIDTIKELRAELEEVREK